METNFDFLPTIEVVKAAANSEQEVIIGNKPYSRNPLGGECQSNAFLAEALGGTVYDTNDPSSHGTYGHTVARIPLDGGQRDALIDVTRKKPLIGTVRHTATDDTVNRRLQKALEVGGWHQRVSIT